MKGRATRRSEAWERFSGSLAWVGCGVGWAVVSCVDDFEGYFLASLNGHAEACIEGIEYLAGVESADHFYPVEDGSGECEWLSVHPVGVAHGSYMSPNRLLMELRARCSFSERNWIRISSSLALENPRWIFKSAAKVRRKSPGNK